MFSHHNLLNGCFRWLNGPQDNTWCGHELVGGEPCTLRRSLVKRLKYNQNELESTKHDTSREILDMVVSWLPPDLVRKGMMRANPNKLNHSYEDGPIVYYRSAESDFYYHALPSPAYSSTENDSSKKWYKLETETGIGGQPQAGDALVWPNFDRDGNPYMGSIHSALPLGKTGQNIMNDNDAGIGKIVINLWFVRRLG